MRCGWGAVEVDCLAMGNCVRGWAKDEDEDEGVDFMPILVDVSYGS